MEPGEIDESEITKSNESEPSRSHGRKGRYKARRQHKRQQTETSLPFEPPKRFRLETHIQRNEPVPNQLPASGHHAIVNPSYAGPETARWAAFRLSKVIKENSLGRLENGVEGLSKFGIRHSMGHKAKVLNTRIRHLKKEIFIRQRQFIDIYDDIFGRKPRKLVDQMDPTTARSMSLNHRRISRLLKCEQPKPSSTSQFRATKRFRKVISTSRSDRPLGNERRYHYEWEEWGLLWLSPLPRIRGNNGIYLLMRIVSPTHKMGARLMKDYYTILSCLGHSTTLHLPELGYIIPMKPGDVAGVLAGQLVHTLIPETGTQTNADDPPTTSTPVVIACWTAGPTEDKITASSHFGH